MRFIHETGFAFELDQIAGSGDDAIDRLLLRIEEECWDKIRPGSIGYGVVSVNWKRKRQNVWHCVTGELVTLCSIVSADP